MKLHTVKYLISIFGIVLSSYFVYSWIYERGSATVMNQWNEEKVQYQKEILRLTSEYEKKEEEHRNENTRITQELYKAYTEYQVAMSSLTGSYAIKLQQSQDRVSIYQCQAEGGEFERRSLASYAARLDNALTEGIQLVRELRETIRIYEQQLTLLGQQIQNDRHLIVE